MKFSVIVPIYKVEKYLKKCIDSILNQKYNNFELILVDDGSPDKCPQICDEYAKKDKRVKVVHKENGGLVSARNVGISVASGEYILYVDGDDWILPELLEDMNEIVAKNKNVDMVIFNLEKLFKNKVEIIPFYVDNGIYNKKRLEEEIYPYLMYDKRKSFCKGIVFPAACNKLYKRELLVKHHCENEQIKMGEDNAFVFECLLYSKNVYFVNKVYYEYNQLNETSFSNSYDQNRFYNNRILTQYMESRIGNLSEEMKIQMNAFKAYWLIMAIFHEVKSKRKLIYSRKHISKEIKKNNSVKTINLKTLPTSAKCFIILLKLHLYTLALIGARIINKKRQ